MAPTLEEIKVGVISSTVAGGLLGLVILLTIDSNLLQSQADLYVENPGISVGFLVHIIHSAIFGVAYAGLVTGYIDDYVDIVLGLTQRSDAIASAFMPIINRFGMAVIATCALGLVFGLLVWLIFSTIFLPAITTGQGFQSLNFSGAQFIGYLFYGAVLGILYGIQITN